MLCTEGSGALKKMKTLGAHDGEDSSGRLGIGAGPSLTSFDGRLVDCAPVQVLFF